MKVERECHSFHFHLSMNLARNPLNLFHFHFVYERPKLSRAICFVYDMLLLSSIDALLRKIDPSHGPYIIRATSKQCPLCSTAGEPFAFYASWGLALECRHCKDSQWIVCVQNALTRGKNIQHARWSFVTTRHITR